MAGRGVKKRQENALMNQLINFIGTLNKNTVRRKDVSSDNMRLLKNAARKDMISLKEVLVDNERFLVIEVNNEQSN